MTPQDVFLDPNLDYVVIEDEDTSLENPVLFSSNRPFVVPKASQPGSLSFFCYQFLSFFGCLRSYPGESTRSHLNSEVKHLWAGLVEWWVTTFESPVLKTFF